MDNQEQLEAIMGLIIYAGNAKSDGMEAIEAAKAGDFALAQQKIAAAEKSIVEAHHAQTEMLTKEAQGNKIEVTLLTIHSQDHLMTAMSFLDIAREIISLHERISS
ncbi:PTS lactose/cellobiose transporter subunit IIA [Vagococcus sp. BWB3-3]|uniref:PTS lactose/cellobiose transporter subunit IIA n=1 Tax=Vagococcus allomyrinae TaxID=2794353 RepID=A0A940PD40_9ENTE|nr:PTS lactose/cellobiose transporter subunit IIA [Vagococcus allomyrinae]MBP1042362.1 PTS lactose/cellobiose transporter subunit IIA [Vagococcus allomyrinae]